MGRWTDIGGGVGGEAGSGAGAGEGAGSGSGAGASRGVGIDEDGGEDGSDGGAGGDDGGGGVAGVAGVGGAGGGVGGDGVASKDWSVVSVLQESLAYLLMVERAETSWSDSLMAKACRRGETVVSLRLPPPTAAIPPRSVASLPCACV